MLRALLSCAAYEPTEKCKYPPSVVQHTDPVPTYGFCVAYQMVGVDRLDSPVVLYVGGSGEEMHTSAEKCVHLASSYGVRFVVFAMPGPDSHTVYRPVLDTVDEAARLAACEAVCDVVRPQYIWGRSMGSSLALAVSSDVRGGIILEAPLASVRTFISRSKPRIAATLEWMGADAYSAVDAAKKAHPSVPVIILYMEHDDVLDDAHASAVCTALKRNGNHVKLEMVRGATHNSEVEDYGPYVPIDFFHSTAYAAEEDHQFKR